MSKCILGIEQPCTECRMCSAKEVNPELEQNYRETIAEIKESGISLPTQKYLSRLVDQDFTNKSCTSATK